MLGVISGAAMCNVNHMTAWKVIHEQLLYSQRVSQDSFPFILNWNIFLYGLFSKLLICFYWLSLLMMQFLADGITNFYSRHQSIEESAYYYISC